MDKAILGGLVTGGISLLGNLIGGKMQQDYTQDNILLQNRLNRENAEWQNQVNIANWQMQNEYNSPVKQIERLKEAGLNPNLLYGNGSASTGLANDVGNVNHGNVGTVSGPSFGDMGMSTAAKTYLDLQRLDKDNQLAQSQMAVYKQQEENLIQEVLGKKIANQRNQVALLHDIFKYNFDQKTQDQVINQMFAEYENTKAQTQSYLAASTDATARASTYDSQTALNYANVALLQARLGLTEAETLSTYQSIKESSARIAESQQRISESKARARGIRYDNRFKNVTFEQRVQQQNEMVTNSIIRNRNGQLEFDVKQYEFQFEQEYGFKPGAHILNSVTGALGTAFNVIF